MKDYEKKIVNLRGFDGEIRLLPIRQEYAKGGLAVDLYDVDTLEPYAVMTVNLSNSNSPQAGKGNVAFVDTNNCPWAKKLIEDNDLGKPTGYVQGSGYCVYPEYEFNESKLANEKDALEMFHDRENSMFQNVIKAVIKEENKEPKVIEIKNNVKEFQKRVGGLIDMTSVPGMEGQADIICNDDFLNNGSSPNVMLPEYDHVMGGCLIFVGYDPNTGASISLTEKQTEMIMAYIDKNKVDGMDFIDAFHAMEQRRAEMKREEAIL